MHTIKKSDETHPVSSLFSEPAVLSDQFSRRIELHTIRFARRGLRSHVANVADRHAAEDILVLPQARLLKASPQRRDIRQPVRLVAPACAKPQRRSGKLHFQAHRRSLP